VTVTPMLIVADAVPSGVEKGSLATSSRISSGLRPPIGFGLVAELVPRVVSEAFLGAG
jgi:hypothetical protein